MNLRSSYSMRWKVIATFTIGLLLLSPAANAEVHTWSDNLGNSVEAEFVRLNGTTVVLKATNRKVIQLPLSDLTPGSQKLAQAEQTASKARDWKVDGKSQRGKYVGFVDGKAKIRIAGKVVEVPFGKLITADANFVRNQLVVRGKSDLLDSLPQQSSAPSLLGGGNPEPASERSVAEFSLDSDADSGEPMRKWKDKNGKSVTARLVDANQKEVTLFVKAKQKEYTLPLSKFSREDQQYVLGWFVKKTSEGRAGRQKVVGDGNLVGDGNSVRERTLQNRSPIRGRNRNRDRTNRRPAESLTGGGVGEYPESGAEDFPDLFGGAQIASSTDRLSDPSEVIDIDAEFAQFESRMKELGADSVASIRNRRRERFERPTPQSGPSSRSGPIPRTGPTSRTGPANDWETGTESKFSGPVQAFPAPAADEIRSPNFSRPSSSSSQPDHSVVTQTNDSDWQDDSSGGSSRIRLRGRTIRGLASLIIAACCGVWWVVKKIFGGGS